MKTSMLCLVVVAALATTTNAAAQPVVPATPTEIAVTAPGPTGTLAGTMITPAPGRPVLIIVPGSGPTDRNGNSPLGIATASYRQLAHGLAARGIGSVRIDKRGMFESRGAGDANAVTMAAYAEDMRSWIRMARTQTGTDCVWLGGHSEGALVALFAAADNADGICGVVTIAAPGRRLGEVLRQQLRVALADTPLLDPALAVLTRLENGSAVPADDVPPMLLGLFNPAVQPFLIDLLSHDPAALAARLAVPLLVVQGSSDLQTTTADARTLASAQPRARLAIIDGVNHVLVQAPAEDRTANIATYSDANRTIDPRVVAIIAAFLTEQPE